MSSFFTSNIRVSQLGNITVLENKNLPEKSISICISHGSAGLGGTERGIAEIFLEKGFKIFLLDHFAELGIKKINWGWEDEYKDTHQVSLLDYLNSCMPPDSKKSIHIGISLGGYYGLANAEKFLKVYSFYPALLPFPKKTNTSDVLTGKIIFLAEKDKWISNPENFFKKLNINNFEIYKLKFAHHSFLAQNKKQTAKVFSYHFKEVEVSRETLNKIQFNNKALSVFSEVKKKEVLLCSSERYRTWALKLIYKNLLEMENEQLNPRKTHQ